MFTFLVLFCEKINIINLKSNSNKIINCIVHFLLTNIKIFLKQNNWYNFIIYIVLNTLNYNMIINGRNLYDTYVANLSICPRVTVTLVSRLCTNYGRVQKEG